MISDPIAGRALRLPDHLFVKSLSSVVEKVSLLI